jgi:outer membrane murein-binding lipoprotein Lpp
MKNSFLLSILLFICFFVNGQNKKQQIELLTFRIDSINSILNSERLLAQQKISELSSTVQVLNKKIDGLTSELSLLNQQNKANISSIKNSEEKISILNKLIDLKNDTIKQLKTPPSLKKKMLTSLIGEHNLISISALAGMNTLLDYNIQKGKWIAKGSSLNQGIREGFDIRLNQDEISKLTSFKIIVNEDLSVNVSCKNKIYFSIPFDDAGMLFDIDLTNDYSMLPSNIEAKTTFLEEKLFLFATDKIQEAISTELSMNDLYINNAVYLSYDTKKKTFELTFFNGDNSSFEFK